MKRPDFGHDGCVWSVETCAARLRTGAVAGVAKTEKVNVVSEMAGQSGRVGWATAWRGRGGRDRARRRRSDAAAGGRQQCRDDGGDGVRSGLAPAAGPVGGVQQRVLELLADVLGVHAHAVVAVRVARAAVLGPRVQQLLPVVRRPVPFVRYADVQPDCEPTTGTRVKQRRRHNLIIR